MPAFLYGPIDTPQEAELILMKLKQEGHIQQFPSNNDIQKYLLDLKNRRASLILSGTVDTPQEVELFLSMLREKGVLSGPIDTPEEVKLFIEKLQKDGLMPTAFSALPDNNPQNDPGPANTGRKPR